MTLDLTKPLRIWYHVEPDDKSEFVSTRPQPECIYCTEYIESEPVYALIRKALCEFKAGRELESVAALAALLPEEKA